MSLLAKTFHFETFPHDDAVWLIRWVGPFSRSRSRSMSWMIKVYLQKEDPAWWNSPAIMRYVSTPAYGKLGRGTIQEYRSALVHAESLPALFIGARFRNGQLIGFSRAPVLTMDLDPSSHPPEVLRTCDIVESRPALKVPEETGHLISHKAYIVPEPNSYCLLLTSEGQSLRVEVVIPCIEVFRALYARDSMLIRALLSGPWSLTLDEVVNSELTGMIDSETAQVILRNGMSESFPEYVANLVLNPDGRKAANQIYPSIPNGASDWHVRVPIPFSTNPMTIEGRLVPLENDGHRSRFLLTEITGTSYPLRDLTVEYARETDSRRGKHQSGPVRPAPFRRANQGILAEPEPLGLTSEEDPSAQGEKAIILVPGARWLDPVSKQRVEKDVSGNYEKPGRKDGPRLSRGSTGRARWGESKSSPAEFFPDPDLSLSLIARFEQILSMMGYLARNRHIDCCRIIEPLDPNCVLYQDGVALWKLPYRLEWDKDKSTTHPWATVGDRVRRSRALMVLEIEIQTARLVWFDVEPPDGGCRALLVNMSGCDSSVHKVVDRVRRNCVRYNGKWGRIPDLNGRLGVTGTVAWTHAYVHSQPYRLSAPSALQAMHELFAQAAR